MNSDYLKKTFIQKSLFANNILASVLVIMYCIVYGIASHAIFEGLQLMFFVSSLTFAVGALYVRDPEIQKKKIEKSILYNQITGTALVAMYLIVFGISGVAFYSGIKLIFFMTSYIFILGLFYLRDPKRLDSVENNSYSYTLSPFKERTPCFVNNQDLSWLIRELNESLSTIIGFSELMLQREFSENEKEFILRNIYQSALSMSCSVNKVSKVTNECVVKPKELHEIADLLKDDNFRSK